MRIGDAFPSKYLRAEDLQGKTPLVTITDVTRERVFGEDRLVVAFLGRQKRLLLNRTNARTIAALLGSEETDDWAGHQIRLVSQAVRFQGGTTQAIRVVAHQRTNGTGE